MDIYSLLKEDHKKVKGLFRKAEDTTERAIKTRKELFQKIKTELEAHTKVEETLFYPRLEMDEETRGLTLEAYAEHKIVKELLAEIGGMPVESETWTAKMKVLIEMVEHHAEEEESDLFPAAKKVLDGDEAEEMANQATTLKRDMGL